MSCTVCSVIPVDGTWVVEHGTTRHGPYMSDGIALQVAQGEALALCRKGLSAKISVEDGAGQISAEYCLCKAFNRARQQAAG